MPGKIKFATFLLIISLTVTLSYIFSDDLYTRYLTFWHVTVKKTNAHDALALAEKMNREHEKAMAKITDRDGKKEREQSFEHEMNTYLSRMVRVFGKDRRGEIIPAGRDLVFFTGFYYLQHGNPVEGASLVLSCTENKIAADEVVPFIQSIEVLYNNKMYGDIASILSNKEYPQKAELIAMHAQSLYYLKKYKQAAELFSRAESAGKGNAEIFIMHSKALSALGSRDEAIIFAEKAYKAAPHDRSAREQLISLLNSAGRHKEAEKISRER
jgi:tetratricopeptide (TPR) repeat protein